MKRIIEAVVAASNLAYMVRESGTSDARLHDAADKTLRRLSGAMDCLSEVKECTRPDSSNG